MNKIVLQEVFLPIREIVLFRHAQKKMSFHIGSQNPELSSEGHRQAQTLVQYIHNNTLPHPNLLLTSPKIRAQQTFQPIQDSFKIPLIIAPSLDERVQNENSLSFELRVKQFLLDELFNSYSRHFVSTPYKEKVNTNNACIYICTHLDWLEVFSWAAPLSDDISSEVLHLPPAHFYHVEINSELNEPWKLLKKGMVS